MGRIRTETVLRVFAVAWFDVVLVVLLVLLLPIFMVMCLDSPAAECAPRTPWQVLVVFAIAGIGFNGVVLAMGLLPRRWAVVRLADGLIGTLLIVCALLPLASANVGSAVVYGLWVVPPGLALLAAAKSRPTPQPQPAVSR